MAGNYNKVLLMGNLTRDVELKSVAGGTSVANIGLAVNRRFRSGEEWKEETTFVDCEAWGRTAETMSKYLSKGRPVFIEGRLKLDQWEDQQGNKRSKMRVVVENFQFIDSGGGGGGSGGSGGGEYSSRGSGGGGGRQTAPAGAGDYEPIQEDDIPF